MYAVLARPTDGRRVRNVRRTLRIATETVARQNGNGGQRWTGVLGGARGEERQHVLSAFSFSFGLTTNQVTNRIVDHVSPARHLLASSTGPCGDGLVLVLLLRIWHFRPQFASLTFVKAKLLLSGCAFEVVVVGFISSCHCGDLRSSRAGCSINGRGPQSSSSSSLAAAAAGGASPQSSPASAGGAPHSSSSSTAAALHGFRRSCCIRCTPVVIASCSCGLSRLISSVGGTPIVVRFCGVAAGAASVLSSLSADFSFFFFFFLSFFSVASSPQSHPSQSPSFQSPSAQSPPAAAAAAAAASAREPCARLLLGLLATGLVRSRQFFATFS